MLPRTWWSVLAATQRSGTSFFPSHGGSFHIWSAALATDVQEYPSQSSPYLYENQTPWIFLCERRFVVKLYVCVLWCSATGRLDGS